MLDKHFPDIRGRTHEVLPKVHEMRMRYSFVPK